ncbi:MAG TPA: hypothetical protein VNW90_02275 [Acetobacteraceae bacterium]|nr:hypothetical protein [Acetobacteraceae bacterium]
MTFDLRDCTLFGPALSESFVRFELEAVLAKLGLLSKAQDKRFEQAWDALRRQLCHLGGSGGPQRVCNQVIAPLAHSLGYGAPQRQDEVSTREGMEDGGWLMQASCGTKLRAWCVGAEADLDAPQRSGRAYRFSPTRSAQRVLLAGGERAGLLTNGDDLRLLLCDPARPDSHITIALAGAAGWRAQNLAPDSYRVLLAFAAPKGLGALAGVLDAARLSQTRVTKDLRVQARNAIVGFLQGVLDHPANFRLRAEGDGLAARLWEEGLIMIYRLLFILKLETAPDPARAFSFASTDIWRKVLSPNRALGPLVRRHLDQGADTGRMLEDGLRLIFQVFRDGLSCSELSVAPLGGALFDARATPLLDGLAWGERSVALLLDRLLWTMPKGRERERVNYGSLNVEDLGRVYEALLELEPGITTEPMARLRRAKLEVVLPLSRAANVRRARKSPDNRTSVTWVEEIPPNRFFLRAGLGRKTTGSYYTPHAFVRFLVRETLAPQIRERSPDDDPNPAAILSLKVVDPAAGSGHFLVEACRFLGEALYAACRLCDEHAEAAEYEAASARPNDRVRLLARADALHRRVSDLPDPDGTLLAYLPSRASEGGESGVSQSRALAICRRLVAVHCLYGVDRNMLAVELAKLSLWLESYAEGLPLTFLDHRLVQGDSLAGPFLMQLVTLPVGGKPLDPLLAQGVATRLGAAVRAAQGEVRALEATLGRDAADLVLKEAAKARLDATLAPLRQLARAWSGAVMLAAREGNDEWLALARTVAATGAWPCDVTERQVAMLEAGSLALPWDLTFPEVFIPDGADGRLGGFDAVLSNPPWDIMQQNTAEFLAGLDLSILDAPTKGDAMAIQNRLLADPRAANAFRQYQLGFQQQNRLVDRLYRHQKLGAHDEPMGGKLDSFRVFAERKMQLAGPQGAIGMLVPSAFHANEGATGIRRLYLREAQLEWCLSFENRRKLFDIHASFKFALVVARRPGPTRTVRCAFYLTDFGQIEDPKRLMEYGSAFIGSSGGAYATLLELRGAGDLAIARRMFQLPRRFGAWAEGLGILLSREAHMTDDASRFTAVAAVLGPGLAATDQSYAERLSRDGYLVLHEGKTIHQFRDRWDTAPRYAIAVRELAGRPQFVENSRYFRAACREIARSTDERTAIAAILPPGVICGHTINVERRPSQRPNAAALTLVAVVNSFAFDWMLRQKAAAHVSLYILAELPIPLLTPLADRFLAHASLRLSCNHRGFLPLWREQLGDVSKPCSWPAVPAEDHRWRLRAAMDAVIANVYGLDRADYEHILGSFSHKSFVCAPEFCLAAFDKLEATGLDAFCRAHGSYIDAPTVTKPAQPVINPNAATHRQHSLHLAQVRPA